MKREDAILMAKEAGFDPGTPAIEDWIERLADAIEARTIERCAKLVENMTLRRRTLHKIHNGLAEVPPCEVAEDIRALKDE